MEIRSALKGLYKKNSLDNNDRVIKSDHFYLKSNGDFVWVSYMFNYETVIKENYFQSGKSKFHPTNINEFPRFKIYMDKWSNLAFKRHDEFQEKLKIKEKIDLELDGFDNKKNLDFYENLFFSSNINDNQLKISENEIKAKEQKEKKAKEEKERKAKEEKERKAKEQKERKAKEQKAKEQKERKAKEQKAKEQKERKAKEEKERKAKEQKAKEEKERKAKEQKAKEEKERKAKDEKPESEYDMSVDDLMSKIKELNEMYKSVIISQDEFEILKNKLLKN